MSTVQLFWHLAKKDLRYLRWWLAAYFAALTLNLAMVPLVARSVDERWIMVCMLPLLLTMLILFLAQSWLVQLDPVLDASAYAVTRPISRTLILAEKLAVWLGCLIVPTAAVAVLQVMVSGLTLPAAEYAELFAQQMLKLVSSLGFCLLLAALTRKIIWLLVTIVAMGAVGGLVQMGLMLFASGTFFSVAATLTVSRTMVNCVIGVLLAGAALWVYYRHRRQWRAAALGVVVVLSQLAINRFWNYDFTGKYLAKTQMAPRQELPDLSQVKVEFTGKPNFSESKTNQICCKGVRMSFKTLNLLAGWFLLPTGGNNRTAVFADGSLLAEKRNNTFQVGSFNRNYARLAFSQFDKPEAVGEITHHYADALLFPYETKALEGREDIKARLTGKADFWWRDPCWSARLS
ncbi:MAG: hypothetical protein LBD30_06170 [Verrucomicrobiales bacterium]|jgi:hypothetical protein|nr:hypothetical protein [Verrucomicrobiales bacterium]